jgi:D-alanyl-D-alanine carboxypeptidase
MGAVSVTVKGDPIFSAAGGFADAEWKIENTVDTRFRTGSIGQQFTAASILLLKENRKFSLADPIGKYLSDLPESWRSATILQLLTHTSGIPIPTYDDPVCQRDYALGPTPRDVLYLLRDRPFLYPHGTKFTYNNTGYFLLGFLIEKLSGMSYERFVQERIFEPLGMGDSGFDDMHRLVARRARGYALTRAGLQNADALDAGATSWSAGGFYSTVNDLTLWSDALADRKLLNAASTTLMFTAYPETEADGMHYRYADTRSYLLSALAANCGITGAG